ncbi:MAG TPA: diaminopimelate decarboxylase [Candidatus Acidoferrales bacterium]|nr:diaminopimelate decarboxylase [Candidatus Acidoferrales bacterium]
MADAHRKPSERNRRGPIDPSQFTPFYDYKVAARSGEDSLFAESVSLEKIATDVGTPSYVYSRAAIENAYRVLDRALTAVPHTLCYAMKANSNLSVLRVLAALGGSFDIVSGGELERLRHIGVPGNRIVFSGVGKTRDEIRDALCYSGNSKKKSGGGILLFNVESEPELDLLIEEASRHVAAGGARPSLAIRVNPDVMAGGHPHISTGQHHHKFGIDWEPSRRLYLAHKDSRWVVWRGISAHIGSQILSVEPYRCAVTRLASYVRDLAHNGVRLDHLDIGGGLGIRYTNESPLVETEYARTLIAAVRPVGCRLMIEPGRAIVGSAGVLLTRVLYVKENRAKTFVIVDAAMNDLIRPVLYDAIHPITPVRRAKGQGERVKRVDVVGPVCESGDFLARDWPLAPVKTGDLLVVWAAGAYAFAQSSNYNARRRPAEVLVEGKRFRIVRKRQSYEDLIRGET